MKKVIVVAAVALLVASSAGVVPATTVKAWCQTVTTYRVWNQICSNHRR